MSDRVLRDTAKFHGEVRQRRASLEGLKFPECQPDVSGTDPLKRLTCGKHAFISNKYLSLCALADWRTVPWPHAKAMGLLMVEMRKVGVPLYIEVDCNLLLVRHLHIEYLSQNEWRAVIHHAQRAWKEHADKPGVLYPWCFETRENPPYGRATLTANELSRL